MNYEIVELEPYSGSEAKVYSIIPEGETETLFEKFLDKKLNDEVTKIMAYAESILQQLDNGNLYWSNYELRGNLKNYNNE